MSGELPRRPGPSARTRVTVHTAERTARKEDRLATEEPLEIRLEWPGQAAHRVWVTMRTPGQDFELATGYLRHEGVLVPGALASVQYCTDQTLAPEEEFNVVTVSLREAPGRHPAPRSEGYGAGSACGVCGKDSIRDVLDLDLRPHPVAGDPDPELVRELPERLREHQPLFSRTGAVHGAGLFDAAGSPLVVREDIGRHNAVDKVVGAQLLRGEPEAAAYIVVSGRAGFELVQKSVAAGHRAMVAVGAPSSLAVRLAEEGGLALFGFVSADRCVQYA